MRLISIPLQTGADGRVIYQGDFEKWYGASAIGNLLVGRYDGPLFKADGKTKRFDWTYCNAAGEDDAKQITNALRDAVQAHLDATAVGLGYDSIYTAVTYADEPEVPKFQIEGQALRAWRSRVWAACHVVMNAVLAGQREVPTAAELIAELPPFVAPAVP